jgi:hypothetical protein
LKLKFLLSTILIVLGVALPSSALGGAERTAANAQNFPDSTGEDPNAPDITSIDVSNDDSGNITIKINISNRPALTPDMIILVWFDTDSNPATGDPQSLGADYALQLVPGDVALFQWNGSDYVAAPSQSSLTYSYDTTGATFHISANDLGKTKAFNFAALAASGIATDANGNPDFTNEKDDFAPDSGHGFYAYPVKTVLHVAVTGFTIAPKPAKSGHAFSAALSATESDTSGPVTTGTIKCAATVAFKPIPATHRLANGIATCSWKLAKTSKGKTLRGTVTLTVQGVVVKRSFTAKIS